VCRHSAPGKIGVFVMNSMKVVVQHHERCPRRKTQILRSFVAASLHTVVGEIVKGGVKEGSAAEGQNGYRPEGGIM